MLFKTESRFLIDNKDLDIFLSEYNIGIEYDDVYLGAMLREK